MTSVVIRNFLSNAIKFTNEKGKITITAIEKQDFVEISVTDTGTGINEDDKLKLFHIDNKLSRNGTANEKGTGLGLNLCKEFIEHNKGKIWFESEIGIGSTFKFTLPNNNS
jgi:signal transduction histidine kinase